MANLLVWWFLSRLLKSGLKFLECWSDFIFLATVFYVSTRQYFSFLTSFYQYFLGITSDNLPMHRLVGGRVTGQVALNEYLKQVSNLKWSVKLCFGKVHSDASIDQLEFQSGVLKIFRLRYLFILHRIFGAFCFIHDWFNDFFKRILHFYVLLLELHALLCHNFVCFDCHPFSFFLHVFVLKL